MKNSTKSLTKRRSRKWNKPEKLLERKDFSFSVPLKPQDKPVDFSKSFKKLMHDEFLNRYLEMLGVTPTATTLSMVKRKLPIRKVKIMGAWKAQGWKADTVQMAPIIERVRSDLWVASEDDILATTIREEEKLFQEMRTRAKAMRAPVDSNRGSRDKVEPESKKETANAEGDEGSSTPVLKEEDHVLSKRFCFMHFNKAHDFMPYHQILTPPYPADTEDAQDEFDLSEIQRPITCNRPQQIVELQTEFLEMFPEHRFQDR